MPDGTALVTERPGRLRLLTHTGLQPQPVAGVPRVVNLFDVAIDPDFKNNNYVYISYWAFDDGMSLNIQRARLSNGRLNEAKTIFSAVPHLPSLLFSGGRLLFLNDGTLLISVGDSFNPSRAQDVSSSLGTIVRVATDGSPPREAAAGMLARSPSVFASGVRNVQGMAIHPSTGEVFFSDHGPIGGDELNVLRPGANYGWPIVSAGTTSPLDVSLVSVSARFDAPITTWTPSIAPSGLAFYSGDQYPGWNGSLFMGSLVQKHLRRLVLQGERVVREEKLLGSLGERIRDVEVSEDGFIYVLTDSVSGRVLRLEPTGSSLAGSGNVEDGCRDQVRPASYAP